MKRLQKDRAFLLALSQGLAKDAAPLVCDDLRGPESLFGEGMKTPRPIRSIRCNAGGVSFESGGLLTEEDGLVLWESLTAAAPSDAAAGIASCADASFASSLSVPAPVFLAGRSTSSFNLAWRLAGDGFFSDWSSLICSCQTEGRGQLRRHWHSPRGNLYVSFRLPRHPAFEGDAASVAVGYLAARAFRRLGFPLTLKWPNDLLIDDRKVGGILLEAREGVLMAGLGVNLSETPPEEEMRTEAAARPGKLLPCHALSGACQNGAWAFDHDAPLAPFPLWRRLLCALILEYAEGIERYGLPYALEGLNSEFPQQPAALPGAERQVCHAASSEADGVRLPPLLAWKGRKVRLSEGEDLCGRMLGVGPGGGLLLKLSDDAERECFSGSLSLSD